MKLREHRDARDFLSAASPLLLADEARHNLAFGICTTLIESPDTYPSFHLWTVSDTHVVGAALMTPPFNLWLARPRRGDVLPLLARELARRGVRLPGVTAARPEVDEFASAWEALRPVRRRLRRGQGIYAVDEPRVPDGVCGHARAATSADRELLIEWLAAFADEALPDDAVRHDEAEIIDRRLTGRAGGLAIWDDGGAVSFAGFGGATPNGIRIGPVYTPPQHRARGYASALVAHLSGDLISSGRRYCFLYTNLANPTSNRIYRNIGYELVCESADYAFDAAP